MDETLRRVKHYNEQELQWAREGLPANLKPALDEAEKARAAVKKVFPLGKGITEGADYRKSEGVLTHFSALQTLGLLLHRTPDLKTHEDVTALTPETTTAEIVSVITTLREQLR